MRNKRARMWPSGYMLGGPVIKWPNEYCYYCGIKMVAEAHPHIKTRDHILPRAVGRIPFGMGIKCTRPSCGACNMLRSALGHCTGLLMLCVTEGRRQGLDASGAAIVLKLKRSREERLAIRRAKERERFVRKHGE